MNLLISTYREDERTVQCAIQQVVPFSPTAVKEMRLHKFTASYFTKLIAQNHCKLTAEIQSSVSIKDSPQDAAHW